MQFEKNKVHVDSVKKNLAWPVLLLLNFWRKEALQVMSEKPTSKNLCKTL